MATKTLILILALLALVIIPVTAYGTHTPDNDLNTGTDQAAYISNISDGSHEIYVGDTIVWSGYRDVPGNSFTIFPCEVTYSVYWQRHSTFLLPDPFWFTSGSYTVDATTYNGYACLATLGGPQLGGPWNYTFWHINSSARPLTANFFANPGSGWVAPQLVTFTSNSTGPVPQTYNWSITESVLGPIYSSAGSDTMSYTVPAGNYDVSLTITNGTETSTKTRTFEALPTSSQTVRTYVTAIDGTSGAVIHGANIDLRETTTGLWTNSSSDADGQFFIDTIPGRTFDAYLSYTIFANSYAPTTDLALPTASFLGAQDRYYQITMFPPAANPGTGNVNMYCTAYDQNRQIVRDVNVVVNSVAPGWQQGGKTGASGTKIFIVPNQTLVKGTFSKAGYDTAATTINTGTGTVASMNIILRNTVSTPVKTLTPYQTGTSIGQIPVTQDPRSNTQKGDATIKLLYDNGETIVQLCILVIIISLLFMIIPGGKR